VNDHTLLYRQAHPSFFNNDRITSQAFVPFPKDDGGLSVDDGDLVTAQNSFDFYTVTLGLESEGIWAVTSQEATELNTPVVATPTAANSAHCDLKFPLQDDKKLEMKEWRKIAKKLKVKATQRGCQYSPVS
jgi:hypothetical protein